MTDSLLGRRFTAIVVTGGPCGGKSTLMEDARESLEALGMRVAINAEVATEFIDAGFSPFKGWKRSIMFQEHLLEYMLEREERYRKMLEGQKTDKPLVLLCDRGAFDTVAYVGKQKFRGILFRQKLRQDQLLLRYKAVVHLVTAAIGAEKHYTLKNNKARSESRSEARDLDAKILAAWSAHPHRVVIDNSTGFKTKIRRAIHSLTEVFHDEAT